MYATPARNIIPMREDELRWRCQRGKKRDFQWEEEHVPRKKEGLGNGIQQGTQLFGP